MIDISALFDFSTIRLSFIADVIDPQPDHRAPALADRKGYPYVGIRDVNPDGSINIETARKVELEAVKKQEQSFKLISGDIVFCKVGTLGSPKLIQPIPEIALSATLVLIKPKPMVDSQFLYYALDSNPVINQCQIEATGSTRQALGIQQIRRFDVPFVSLDKQKTIASFLDRKTATIDALIAKKQRLIELLEEKRTALINHAVTKGLNPNVAMKDSGVPWIGEIPEHWEVLHLKRVIASSDYGISAQLEPIGIYPVLRMGNLQNGKVEMNNLKFVNEVDSRLILKPDDILFNRTNSLDLVGKVALFRGYAKAKVTYASYLVRFRTNQLAYPEYLVMFLGRKEVQHVARAMALPAIGQVNLNPNRYGYLRICLPPLSEQITISTWLTNKLTQLQQPINQINLQIEKLQEYRQSLITAAVTGKININKEETT